MAIYQTPPEEIFLRKDRSDFVGTKLLFLKAQDNKAYYTRLDGVCSLIKCISLLLANDPSSENRSKFSDSLFLTEEDLHDQITKDLKADLECIDRYRNTGKYFS